MPKLKKQKSNKISKNTQIGALLEHMDEKITLVAEQYTGLNKKIDKIASTQEYHTEMIGNLTINFEVVKADVEFIKNSLKKKVDAEEFEALEKRVSSLESRLLKH